MDGESRGYPVVTLSFQRVINGHGRIIHGNQQDRNSGGAIWSRGDSSDGDLLMSNLLPVFDTYCSIGTEICILGGRSKDYSVLARV